MWRTRARPQDEILDLPLDGDRLRFDTRPIGTTRSTTPSAPSFRRRLFRRLYQAPMPRTLHRRIYPHGALKIPIDEGHSFLMRSRGEYIENDLYRFGYGRGWEGMSLLAWSRLGRQAATIIDIGAYRGIYALAAKCVNPKARVVAFEPVASNHRIVVENAELNGYEIVAEQAAVSDRTGTAVLFDSPKQKHALSSLERPPPAAYVEIEVPVVSLDDYAREKQLTSVDLVKMDIEGHEPAAVRGMTVLLARWKPALIIEVLTDDAGSGLIAGIGQLGYAIYEISETDGLQPIDRVRANGRGSRNFLFCQPEMFEAAALAELLDGR